MSQSRGVVLLGNARSSSSRRKALRALTVCFGLIAASLTFTDAPAATPCASPPTVFPESSITPGMIGTGLTASAVDASAIHTLLRSELRQMIEDLRSVPSIVAWVPFNEKWGQFDTKRIVGIILTQKDASWFFKMRGPAELTAREQGAFEAFVGSVKFQ